MQHDSPDTVDPLPTALIDAVGTTLEDFLDGQEALLTEIGSVDLLPVAREATRGGKRLRPAFCYWGYVAAAGRPADETALLKVASSLDLLHVSALVHDDLIDASDTRRGQPAAHRRFEQLHTSRAARGSAADFGTAAAILLGDLLLMWSIELADASEAPRMSEARHLLAAMRSEVTAGQFLDVAAQYGLSPAATLTEELAVAQRVLEFKSARYSIRRPAQIGAALGGASSELQSCLAEFGSVLGRAFQLRDDVLGSFGDPALTGKPYGGDLREGKRTILVLHALTSADTEVAAELTQLLNSPGLSHGDVARAAELIEASGALDEVERLITHGTEQALALLDQTPMTQEGRDALRALTLKCVHRVA